MNLTDPYDFQKPLLIIVMVSPTLCTRMKLTSRAPPAGECVPNNRDDVTGAVSEEVSEPELTDSGKSTVGAGLAKNISVPFIDGDSLHPQSSVDKMSAGQPLTDEDRLPWLHAIRRTGIQKCKEEFEDNKVTSKEDGGIGRPAVVIACSALKKKYRNVLRGTAETVDEPEVSTGHKLEVLTEQPKLRTAFVYCKGSPELLQKRISERKGHFMKPDMLASQLATLEDPEKEGGVVTVEISKSASDVVEDATEGIKHLVTVMDHQGL